MYNLFLCDDSLKKTKGIYGYWTGKTRKNKYCTYPECDNDSNSEKIKWYKSLKRVISAGKKALDKYDYVMAFYIEDEMGNTIYESNKESAPTKQNSDSVVPDCIFTNKNDGCCNVDTDDKIVTELLLSVWNIVDQESVQHYITYAFKNCPYRIKKEILFDLYEYAIQDKKPNPGNLEMEKEEILERIRQLLETD